MDKKPKTLHPLLHVFTIRDFSLLWSGGTISMLGSQFSLIAMPWLVLQLTGDPLALGAILALEGIPRVAFMLVGGAISDRFSPRLILLLCDWINFALVGLSAILVFTGLIQVWMLYVFGLITGLLSGFVIPAANSIVPLIVPDGDLQAGNSVQMGSSQLVGLVGPALAGIVVGVYAQSARGIAVAFAIDSLSFAVSALALWAMRGGRRPASAAATPAAGRETIWHSITIGVRYLVGHQSLRFMFLVMIAVNFLFTGPLLVGIPVLADQRLPEGARAFGFLMSAYSGGNLLGYLLAGTLPRPSGRTLSTVTIAVLLTFGLVLGAFGWIALTWLDILLLAFLGIGNGYIALVFLSWIQQRTPREMLGRMMSIFMLAGNGLVPVSMILTGFLLKNWTLTGLFALAGGLILLTAAWSAMQPALKALSQEVVAATAD